MNGSVVGTRVRTVLLYYHTAGHFRLGLKGENHWSLDACMPAGTWYVGIDGSQTSDRSSHAWTRASNDEPAANAAVPATTYCRTSCARDERAASHQPCVHAYVTAKTSDGSEGGRDGCSEPTNRARASSYIYSLVGVRVRSTYGRPIDHPVNRRTREPVDGWIVGVSPCVSSVGSVVGSGMQCRHLAV